MEGETVRIIGGEHAGKAGVVIEEPPLDLCDSQIKIHLEGETHNRMFWPEHVQYEGADDPIPERVTVEELEVQKAELVAALKEAVDEYEREVYAIHAQRRSESIAKAASAERVTKYRGVLAKYASKGEPL